MCQFFFSLSICAHRKESRAPTHGSRAGLCLAGEKSRSSRRVGREREKKACRLTHSSSWHRCLLTSLITVHPSICLESTLHSNRSAALKTYLILLALGGSRVISPRIFSLSHRWKSTSSNAGLSVSLDFYAKYVSLRCPLSNFVTRMMFLMRQIDIDSLWGCT